MLIDISSKLNDLAHEIKYHSSHARNNPSSSYLETLLLYFFEPFGMANSYGFSLTACSSMQLRLGEMLDAQRILTHSAYLSSSRKS